MSWYSLILFFKDLLLIFSSDMQHLKQLIFLSLYNFNPTTPTFKRSSKSCIVSPENFIRHADIRSINFDCQKKWFEMEKYSIHQLSRQAMEKPDICSGLSKRKRTFFPHCLFWFIFLQIHRVPTGKWLSQICYIQKKQTGIVSLFNRLCHCQKSVEAKRVFILCFPPIYSNLWFPLKNEHDPP